MQFAAATAANGTNRPIRGEMCCKEVREGGKGGGRKKEDESARAQLVREAELADGRVPLSAR